jgi:DNA-directed RNA polymerase specialized sigma24 family protein
MVRKSAARPSSNKGVYGSSASPPGDRTDGELARIACLNSREAWELLFLRYWDFLNWLATQRFRLRSETRAHGGRLEIRGQDITVEQLASEVYIRVWEKRKLCSYEERAEFRWWYSLVIKNILEDLRREERRIGPPGERVPLMREEGE